MRRTDGGGRSAPEPASLVAAAGPAFLRIDCSGMRCPQPVLRLGAETSAIPAGTVVEIVGDCPTFEKDVRVFCERRKKTLLAIRTEGTTTTIRIQY